MREQAAGQYQAAVRREPTCAEGWLALGNIVFTDGRLKEAEKYFRRALKASPHDPGASNNLAMVILARSGSLPKAEALARDALRQAGALRPYVLDTLANVYLLEGRYVEAAAIVDQAEAAALNTPAVRDQLLATSENIKAAALGLHHATAELQR
jgi:Flp pilus assembly protein TadD